MRKSNALYTLDEKVITQLRFHCVGKESIVVDTIVLKSFLDAAEDIIKRRNNHRKRSKEHRQRTYEGYKPC